MGVNVTIDGLAETLESLSRLESEQITKAARYGLWDGLKKIEGEAKMLCPVDTGQLRDSIKSRIVPGKHGELLGEVYVFAEHARYVEFGTGPRGEKNHAGIDPDVAGKITYSPKGWSYPDPDAEDGFAHTLGMPARPFLYPAFKSREGEAKEEIRKALSKLVQNGA